MISKQNLWFLTLFSLILVLSVYYITMPNDLLKEANKNVLTTKENKKKKTKETVEELSSLTTLRVSLQEERTTEINALQKRLTSEDISSDEKNSAYEKMKYIKGLEAEEENIEKEIKKKYKLDCFTKIDNTNIETTCISSKHDNVLANNIMRLIQENFNNKMFITVKFDKK